MREYLPSYNFKLPQLEAEFLLEEHAGDLLRVDASSALLDPGPGRCDYQMAISALMKKDHGSQYDLKFWHQCLPNGIRAY